MTYKIYLAASYSRREEMEEFKEQLEDYGYEVTSRWITEHSSDGSELSNIKCALEDWNDVSRADCLLLFTEPNVSTLPDVVDKETVIRYRGARQFEFGAAVAMGKTVIVYGYKEHVFSYLPTLYFVDIEEGISKVLLFLEYFSRAKDSYSDDTLHPYTVDFEVDFDATAEVIEELVLA